MESPWCVPRSATRPFSLKLFSFHSNSFLFTQVANVSASIYNDTKAESNSKLVTVIQQAFTTMKKPFVWRAADAPSDFLPFLVGGVPTISLSAGTVSIKTATEKAAYGGLEGAAYDPCFAKPCDSLTNINKKILEELAKVGAMTLQTLVQANDVKRYVHHALCEKLLADLFSQPVVV